MKLRLALVLLLFTGLCNAQSSIGIMANYNGGIELATPSNMPFHNHLVSGLYFNAPIYKRLHYNVGLNFIHLEREYNGPRLLTYPYGATILTYKWSILEIPMELVLGLYKRPEAKTKGYFHAGYALGSTFYNRKIYSANDNVVGTETQGGFGKTLHHSFRFEVELRWVLAKKYTASFFLAQRNINYGVWYDNWESQLGIGFRFGLNLPQKSKS